MKSADEFLIEQENKPVYYHIYCYYDSDLKRYNQPVISSDEPGFILESTKASILKGKFPADQGAGLILAYLGKFDLKSGKFELFDEPICLLDLNSVYGKKVEVTDVSA